MGFPGRLGVNNLSTGTRIFQQPAVHYAERKYREVVTHQSIHVDSCIRNDIVYTKKSATALVNLRLTPGDAAIEYTLLR